MSKLDIINRALTRIGAETLNDLTGTGKTTKTAVLMYQAGLDFVLRTNPWACAVSIVRLKLASDIVWQGGATYALDDLCTNDGILYGCKQAGVSAYGVGPDGITDGITDGSVIWDALDRVDENFTDYQYVYVYPANCLKVRSVGTGSYLVMGWFIYSDEEDATANIIKRIFNTDSLDPLLAAAISAKLAELLAPTFGKMDIGVQLIQEYQLALKIARAESASEAQEDAAPEPRWTDI